MDRHLHHSLISSKEMKCLILNLTVLAFAFAYAHGSSDHVSSALAPRGAQHISFSSFLSPRRGQVHSPVSPSVPLTPRHHARMWTHGFSSSPETPYNHPVHKAYKPLLERHKKLRGGKATSPSPSPARPPTLSPSNTITSEDPSPKKKIPSSPIMALPPSPVNGDCTAVTCTKPFTSTPIGYPCGCVQPIQVKLSLDVALYSFFPLVSELTSEIASSLSLNRSQVRVVGANAASQRLEKTNAVIDLVPLMENFKYNVALSTYKKFWRRRIDINSTLFGVYRVVYVHYPGLPPSPPTMSPDFAGINEHRFPLNGNGDGLEKPLGVAIPKVQKKKSNGVMIAVIVLSVVTAFVVCTAVAWILIMKRKSRPALHLQETAPSMSSTTKMSGAPRSLTLLSGPQSVPSSSGTMTFIGTAKTFSISELERATNGFDSSRVLGEGGFGVVYNGVLDNGEKVAVKVLKRDDRQGAREFLAEVEMLSRLHHRNLVKLIGICREDSFRCLVYELVPNGSVESHLHGVDKENNLLDWETRLKIALGSARGLAYLHEDSSPCVIHRDFKSSNILLEHDFTPKVSDFGLARAALDEGNPQISTQVMGTFGYLAPEYAMTGHLLVKSDVYSYGVVLLEILTGRKPVDFTQPQGQENLVAWARPHLANKDGLQTIIDPSLTSALPLDSLSKVAAIASMCVSPEVSRRPFMGEVVQALKLICSEVEDCRREVEGVGSSSRAYSEFSVQELDLDDDEEISGEIGGYELVTENRVTLSTSNLRSEAAFEEQSHSLENRFGSGPLELGKNRRFWQRFKRFSRDGTTEHGQQSYS
ncbi:hypothetical protein V2J09_003038 [Rumex salicifolius]